LGDPAGVGPRLLARLLPHLVPGHAYVFYAEEKTLRLACRLEGVPFPFKKVERLDEVKGPGLYLVDLNLLSRDRPEPSLEAGRAAAAYLARGVADAVKGELFGLLTMPISKLWARRAGFSFPGQTEFLAHASGVKRVAMVMYSGKLKLALHTTHVPLRHVFNSINKKEIETKLRFVINEWEKLFKVRPRVKVLGLNPHAGEGGELGREELTEIRPAVEALRAEGFEVEGPLPPDAAFVRPSSEALYYCMYHDQGLAPFKALAFDEGVNLTLGLPFVRVSPDHGTAYEVAWEGELREGASVSALRLLYHLLDLKAQGA